MGIKKDKTIMYITYTVVLAFVLFNYKEVLNIIMNIISLATPFYIAVVIAFILNIPMKKIENLLSKKIKKKNILRGASLALTLICTALILVLFFSFIIPKLVESVILIFTNLLNYTSTLVTMINKTLEQLHIHYAMDFSDIQSLIQQNFDINNIIIKGTDFLGQTGFNIIFQSIGLVNTFINGIASFMMGLYLLANKELHITQVKKFITFIFGYKKSLSIIDIGIEANHYFNGFVSGQLLECCIFMTLMYIVLRFIGLPFPELMAVIIALSSLVPMFGTFVGLSGLYVLLALVVFGNLFGFVGLLIAVPSMAVIYAIGSRVINLSLYKQHIEVTFNKISKFKDEE